MFIVLPSPSPEATPEGKASEEYKKELQQQGITQEKINEYWSNPNNSDPYARASNQINNQVETQVPKVSINNGKIKISAPQSVLDSPITQQLKTELQSLKGVDLQNPNTVSAIDALNEELKSSWQNELIKRTIGWTPEEYKDYQYLMQTISSTNPMNSSNKVKAKAPGGDGSFILDSKTGKAALKTPKEWEEYWRTIYTTDERVDAFNKSYQSSDPYERTMALILGQGSDKPVYGFDVGERIGQGLSAFGNQMSKFPEGAMRLVGTDFNTRRVENLSKQLKISAEALQNPSIQTEEQFNSMKESIKGKSWKDLTDEQKAFVLEVGVSKENKNANEAARSIAAGTPLGRRTDDLNNMSSDNETNSRLAIDNILQENSFDKYKRIRDNYTTWQGYDRDLNQNDERLAKNAIMSEGEQIAGNIAGTIGRFAWEAAVMRGLTGGISAKSLSNPKLLSGANVGGFKVNAISDKIGGSWDPISKTGSGIVGWLGKHNISPVSDFGRNALQFTANLIGTIPEDILQTSIDNVVTYNMDENNNLLDPEQMSENFKNNLIWMSAFNALGAGINAVKKARLIKKIAKQADMNQVVDIFSDADDFRRAVDDNNVKIEDNQVKVIDDNGNEKVLKNTDPEQVKAILSESDDISAVKNIDEDVVETPKIKTDTIETESVKGKYNYNPLDNALSTLVRPIQSEIQSWHRNTLKSIMDDFDNNFINKFYDKFKGVQASDFDWVWYQSKQGKTPSEIIGTKDPTTGRVITKDMIDAMEWWGNQPQTKALRQASRDTLGLEGDFNVLGYLPHTDYDPTNSSFEEALTGALWQTSTGASVMEEGKYKGYGGDFRNRYSTFVSNMLWDARAKDVAAAKLLDEVRMDGQEITPELEVNARKAVDEQKNIQKLVNDSDSTKAIAKVLESGSDIDRANWEKLTEAQKTQAENSGLGKAIHDVLSENKIYYGSDSHSVAKQGKAIANNFDALGNTMRNTTIEGIGSWYDNGGEGIVYAEQNAIDIVNRFMRDGGNFRDMLLEYVENHSNRPPKYAEEIVDKWMGKLGDIKGPLTKAKVVQTLSNSMKWEAMARFKRWLALSKYDQFNDSTRKTIDRFLFNHMQMDSIKHNPTISQRLTKGLNDLTSLRYRALFYGNLKNALLQVSELNRLFTVFKLGDVATMAKRLATDADFRAKVDDYVESVAPMTNQLKSDIYNAYSNVADNMEVSNNGVTFKDLGKKTKETADAIGLAPIEAAEAFKNRTMVAALVQEADRLESAGKLSGGDEKLRYIRNRFERVALASNEMGKIGLASNPLAKTVLFLQNFQIRELGMHIYNIKDATGMAKTIPKKVLAAANYITKVLGTKLATTLILARLGYSAKQTLGIDPFGLTDNYTGMDEEDMEWIDQQISGGVLTPFFSGGMTSLISDMYFMARKAYEDSNQETPSEEAEQRLGSSWGLEMPNITFDSIIGGAANFVPGSVFANRINQMNEMMDKGWATSASGNKMYTAPDDVFNAIMGYLFGRSATQNAQQYNQTYGDNLWQTLGRFVPGRNWGDFDPIDTKNYSDWFKGDANDKQQFEKGRRYFQNERDHIIDTYESVISKSYATDDEIAEAKNNMNVKLEELYDKLERFVDAYERKNGTIDSAMVKKLVNLLNTGRNVVSDTPKEAEDRSMREYNKALDRYSALGLSPVGTYSGANKYSPEAETKYQGSPQWRSAVGNIKNQKDEVVAVLKLADETLAPIRKSISDSISAAYNKKDWTGLEKIQKAYLKEFDNVVAPIIAAYGNGIFGSTDITNQIKDMLSTGTGSRSGNLIPSDQYRKDKYGRYVSTPFETVDVKKWAQYRYSGKTYKQPTVKGNSTVAEDINEIKRLSNNGQKSRARARALVLKARVDNQIRTLSQEQYDWLNKFLEGGK